MHKKLNNARDTNYFTKNLQIVDVVNGARWKTVKSWSHQ